MNYYSKLPSSSCIDTYIPCLHVMIIHCPRPKTNQPQGSTERAWDHQEFMGAKLGVLGELRSKREQDTLSHATPHSTEDFTLITKTSDDMVRWSTNILNSHHLQKSYLCVFFIVKYWLCGPRLNDVYYSPKFHRGRRIPIHCRHTLDNR